jgi:hypothetical protein
VLLVAAFDASEPLEDFEDEPFALSEPFDEVVDVVLSPPDFSEWAPLDVLELDPPELEPFELARESVR